MSLRSVAVWLALGMSWGGAQSGNSAAEGMPPGYLDYVQACAAQHSALVAALTQARLPFDLGGTQPDPSLEFTPRCALTKIFSSGTMSLTALDHVLNEAGFAVALDEVTTAPPRTFPPTAGDTWPISAEAVAIAPQKTGSVLKVRINLQNWTVFRRELGWGLGSVDYILLNERGETMRWNGDGLIPAVGILGTCTPLNRCTPLSVNVPLDHFNPALPLEPGRYTLRLRVDDVGIGGGMKLAATLPDLPFQIVP
jgi:hypothetical protein